MNTGERLAYLAGTTGTAASLLLLLAGGATAGEALVSFSGYPSATAEVHLLADKASADPVHYVGGGLKRRQFDDATDADIIRMVNDRWDVDNSLDSGRPRGEITASLGDTARLVERLGDIAYPVESIGYTAQHQQMADSSALVDANTRRRQQAEQAMLAVLLTL